MTGVGFLPGSGSRAGSRQPQQGVALAVAVVEELGQAMVEPTPDADAGEIFGFCAFALCCLAAGQAGLLAVTDQRLQLPHGLVARGGWPVLLIHGCGLISDAGKGAVGSVSGGTDLISCPAPL